MKGLVRAFKSQFDPDVCSQGDELFAHKTVKINRKGLFSAEANVRDTEPALVQLEWALDQKTLTLYCDCQTFELFGPCPHVWASLRYLEDSEFYVPGDRRHVELQKALAPFLDLPSAKKVTVGVSSWGDPQKPSSVSDVLDGLQKQLEKSSPLRVTFKSTVIPKRELWYAFHRRPYSDEKQPFIELYQREFGQSGWGQIKKFKAADPRALTELPAEDQQIFHLLKKTDTTFGLQNPVGFHSNERCYGLNLPSEFYEKVLPLLAATGRLVLKRPEANRPDTRPMRLQTQARTKIQIKPTDSNGYKLGFSLQGPDKELALFNNDEVQAFPQGLFLYKNSLQLSQNPDTWKLIEKLKSSERTIPEKDIKHVVRRLLTLVPKSDLSWPENLPIQLETSPVQLRLKVQSPELTDKNLKLFFSLEFVYGEDAAVQTFPFPYHIQTEDESTFIARNNARENELREELSQLCDVQWFDAQKFSGLAHISDAESFFKESLERGWDVFVENQKLRYPQTSNFQIQSSGVDWFDVKANVQFGKRNVELEELLQRQSKLAPFVPLGNGEIGLLPEQWLRQISQASLIGSWNEGQLGLTTGQVTLLSASEDLGHHLDPQLHDKLQQVESLTRIEPATQPKQLQGELRNYQRKGLDWLIKLYDSGFGGCLADDMGLGKTIQVLSLFQHLKNQGQLLRPNLVVVPRSLVHNWKKEAEKFTPDLDILDYSEGNRHESLDLLQKSDVVVTTYGIALRDVEELQNFAFHMIVLDEAQTIKNARAKTHRALRSLKASHRLIVTGTPIENHLNEFVNLFDFLNPGLLGPRFKKAMETHDSGKDVFKKATSPLILRRRKAEVLTDLPEKVEQVVYCELTERQHELYQDLKQHYRDSLTQQVQKEGWARSQAHVLEGLLRLRQMACHPGLIDPNAATDSSGKLDSLIDLLTESLDEGHSALVYSQFTKHLKIVAQALDRHKISYDYLDGQTRNRQKVIEHFQERSEPSVFLISLKAGGVGLNLTRADYCFILDPWWNPAVESQAIDRTHRIGQKNTVFAYRLVSRGTVEEKILELQSKKRELANSFLDQSHTGRSLGQLRWEDIEYILS